MNKLTLFFYIVVISVVQIGVFGIFRIGGATPALVVLAVIWMSLNKSFKHAVVTAAIGGTFLDLYASTVFGANLASLVLLAWLLNFVTRKFIPKEGALLTVSLTVLAIILVRFFSYFFNSVISYFPQVAYLPLGNYFDLGVIWKIFYTLILLYPFELISQKIFSPFYETQKPF